MSHTLAVPQSMLGPRGVATFARNMDVTMRCFVGRWTALGGSYAIASLPSRVRKELKEELGDAECVDRAWVRWVRMGECGRAWVAGRGATHW